MKFYTSVLPFRGKLLVRGVNHDGTHKKFRINYQPSLFIPSKKESKYKTLKVELKKLNGKNTYVFQSPISDSYYEKSVFNKLFRRFIVGLGLVDKGTQKSLYTPHSIRHSVVSDLIQKGVNIYNISKLLRHTDIRTTINIYSHLLPSDLENTMEKIGG